MENKVELTGIFGSDTTIALSAWTSTSRDLTFEKLGRIPDLLKFLAENGHETPFEKSYLQFLITCDTASHIHLLKHRIGVSINSESARYKELQEDKYYIPEDWPEELKFEVESHFSQSYHYYHFILNRLESSGMDRKRAKESARFILPYANQLTLDVSFNWRSFSHFLGLRNTAHAQKEIKDIASQMLYLVETLEERPFQHTIAAFREAGLLGDE